MSDAELAEKARQAMKKAAFALEDLANAGLVVEVAGSFEWYPGRAYRERFEPPRLIITRRH